MEGVALIPAQALHWAEGRECNFGKGGPWIGFGFFGCGAMARTGPGGDRRGGPKSITDFCCRTGLFWCCRCCACLSCCLLPLVQGSTSRRTRMSKAKK